MAAWTSADVKKIASEFDAVLQPDIDYFIDMAQRQIDDVAFGERARDAGAFLTAHLMTVCNVLGEGNAAATGAVASVTVGQVSVSYAQVRNAMHADSLSSNRYGMEFERLCNLGVLGAMVI